MDNNSLINIIDNPELLDKVTEEELESLLKKNPYFSFEHVLLLKKKKLESLREDSPVLGLSPRIKKLLAKVSFFVPDRNRLFRYIESLESFYSDYFNQSIEEKDISKEVSTSVSDQDIENKNEKNTSEKSIEEKASKNYGYDLLDQLENMPENESSKKMKGEDIIDDFIEHPISLVANNRIEKQSLDESVLFDENKLKEYPDATFTQTLAKIYFKQGRYDKCLMIIKALYLKYPKKNTYFAEQIEQLEKIINNK